MRWKAVLKPQMRENYFALALWRWIEAANTLKYKRLTKELQRMWNTKTEVITSYNGATKAISEAFRKYLNISGKDIKDLQETTIMGTAYILRQMLALKNKKCTRKNCIKWTTYYNNRTGAKLYTTETYIRETSFSVL